MLPIATVVIALVLGAGALQELIVRGVQGGEVQPFWIGVGGLVVCALLLLAAFAMWKRWPSAGRLATLAGSLSIAFHLYAALPPHRNVGGLALVLGLGVGLAMLWGAWTAGRGAPAARMPAA